MLGGGLDGLAQGAPPGSTVEATFERLCSSCHGALGDGAGQGGKALMPRPADLTGGRYMRLLKDDYLTSVIRDGKVAALRRNDQSGLSSASMPGFSDVLSAKEVAELTDWAMQPEKPLSAAGRENYRNYCDACHGPEGRGDGQLTPGLQPPPADFTDVKFMRRFNRKYLIDVISHGKVATIEKLGYANMPGFGSQLDEAMTKQLVAYIRKLGMAK